MKPKHWKCPYCGHAQIVTDTTFDSVDFRIRNDLSRYGPIGGRVTSLQLFHPFPFTLKGCRDWSGLKKRTLPMEF